MAEHPLRRILSRIRRATPDPARYEVVYIHRGAENDQAVIDMSMVGTIAKGSFTLSDGETMIPFHRVIRVRNLEDGRILWEKRTTTPSDSPRP